MIYISYGVTKSASTYVYQLTEAIFLTAGLRPVPLSTEVKGRAAWENYVDPINGEALEKVRAAIGDGSVVIKTHDAPDEQVVEQVKAGTVFASAVIRDPREISLAMIDHGRRSLSQGIQDFAEFEEPLQAIANLERQFTRFLKWSVNANVPVFTYNEVCFDTV